MPPTTYPNSDLIWTITCEIGVEDYVSSPEIRARVHVYLHRLQTFVGTVEDVSRSLQRESTPNPEVLPVEPTAEAETGFFYFFDNVPEDIKDVVKELREGESWNALARLRRKVELRSIEAAKVLGLSLGDTQWLPPKVIARELSRLGLVDPKYLRHLDTTLTACNKAVHGLTVTSREVEEAIASGQQVLDKLSKIVAQ